MQLPKNSILGTPSAIAKHMGYRGMALIMSEFVKFIEISVRENFYNINSSIKKKLFLSNLKRSKALITFVIVESKFKLNIFYNLTYYRNLMNLYFKPLRRQQNKSIT